MKQLTQADRRRIAPKLLQYWIEEATRIEKEDILVDAVFAIATNNPKGVVLGQGQLRKWGQVADQLGEEYEVMVQFGFEIQEKRFWVYRANVLDRLKGRQPRGKKGNRKQQ